MAGHISDDALERYMMGAISNKTELATVEKHLLVCAWCIERAEKTEVSRHGHAHGAGSHQHVAEGLRK